MTALPLNTGLWPAMTPITSVPTISTPLPSSTIALTPTIAIINAEALNTMAASAALPPVFFCPSSTRSHIFWDHSHLFPPFTPFALVLHRLKRRSSIYDPIRFPPLTLSARPFLIPSSCGHIIWSHLWLLLSVTPFASFLCGSSKRGDIIHNPIWFLPHPLRTGSTPGWQ